MIRTFYYDSSSDEGIESSEAREMTLENALETFYNLSEEKGSFIGFKTNDKIIQFDWNDDNLWMADIPDPQKRGSFQKECDYDQCVEIIKSAFDKPNWQIPNDFGFMSW
ncbi:hypothetical protein [Chryseobacterium lathyri]|uniref:Uncharacterized protein n=1 Tax=Chryseobacterium lathyri TaxID=395933 RepID=A0A511Y7W1_9FLAO|nr:hypothetical protein [Chryseobacterium lathyri]GEN71265.1 hypothetical protein CLA01_13370 [Chryseobacterium lathyri]